MKKKLPIILLNFSDVYDYESFASSQEIVHVDCRELNGVDCYSLPFRAAVHRGAAVGFTSTPTAVHSAVT